MDEPINYKDLLKPDVMIRLYARGLFPMADNEGVINWYMPESRTILPLDNYNVPRSLNRYLERNYFRFRYDNDVMKVVKLCAERDETWISEELIDAYGGLYNSGYLHSVETYRKDKLVGGLFGVSYRGAFFGESMFNTVSQSSKAALVKLIERLNRKQFSLLDVQYQTEHLSMFGTKEIDLEEYMLLLDKAYQADINFSD